MDFAIQQHVASGWQTLQGCSCREHTMAPGNRTAAGRFLEIVFTAFRVLGVRWREILRERLR